MIKVRVLMFAVARQIAGREVLAVELPESARVADLRSALAREAPGLEAWLPSMLFAVGQEYVEDEVMLHADDEIACIPPVSGG